MEKHEELIEQIFVNKILKDVEFFDTDAKYLSPDMDQTWIIDGGVQFQLDDDFFSFAFTSKMEFFDLYDKKIDQLNNEFSVESLGAKDVERISYLINKKITSIEVKWNYYAELDENLDLKPEKNYMPVEIILYFDDSRNFLQLAVIDYGIRNGDLCGLQFDSSGDLLISANKRLKIQELSLN